MHYVLHEPIAREGDPPVIRRLLLTSANLSAAPWGYVRGGKVEIRNFELGVCVKPEQPQQLVEPLGSLNLDDGARRSAEVWAQAIPFDITKQEPCDEPYLGRSIVYRCGGQAENGHLNY